MPEPPIAERKPGMFAEEDGHWWVNGRWVTANGYFDHRRQFYCHFELRNTPDGPATPGYLTSRKYGGYDFVHLADILARQRGANA